MTFFDIFSKSGREAREVLKPKIIIDNREKNSLVPSELVRLGFEIEFKQLAIGDYLVGDVAIERKTVSDLKSSIINKRIFRQLEELRQYPKRFLIVEGFFDMDVYEKGFNGNSLRGFLVSLIVNKEIPVLFTKDAEDTARYIYVLSRKKDKGEVSIRAGKKIRNEKEQGQFILEGFQGIGPTASKKLVNKFGSLREIFNAGLEELKEVIGSRADEFYKILAYRQ